jgi:hypothetical protein
MSSRLGLGVVVVLILGTATSGAAAVRASSETRFPAGAVGTDVSYPQCDPNVPENTLTLPTGQFGIVGLTQGLPWVENDCAGTEWAAASDLPAVALYMNTANPAPTSTFYWPETGARDPSLCRNAKSVADPGCAYDYGWHAAQDAFTTITTDQGISDPSSMMWWLDVEADNTWNGTPTANAADLQGMVDYLRKQHVPSVGIYTSKTAWTSVTGGYDKANAATYAKAWRSELTASYPMTASPIWKLGIGTKSSATRACKAISPTGAATWLAQYAGKIDHDLACPTEPTASFQLTTNTGRVTLGKGQKKTIKITITESGPTQPIHLTLKTPTGIKARLSRKAVTGTTVINLTTSISTSSRGSARGVHYVTITATGITGTRSKKEKIKSA